MYTYIINTNLLTLYLCDMFQPSKADTFQQQGQQSELPDVKFNLLSSV